MDPNYADKPLQFECGGIRGDILMPIQRMPWGTAYILPEGVLFVTRSDANSGPAEFLRNLALDMAFSLPTNLIRTILEQTRAADVGRSMDSGPVPSDDVEAQNNNKSFFIPASTIIDAVLIRDVPHGRYFEIRTDGDKYILSKFPPAFNEPYTEEWQPEVLAQLQAIAERNRRERGLVITEALE